MVDNTCKQNDLLIYLIIDESLKYLKKHQCDQVKPNSKTLDNVIIERYANKINKILLYILEIST